MVGVAASHLTRSSHSALSAHLNIHPHVALLLSTSYPCTQISVTDFQPLALCITFISCAGRLFVLIAISVRISIKSRMLACIVSAIPPTLRTTSPSHTHRFAEPRWPASSHEGMRSGLDPAHIFSALWAIRCSLLHGCLISLGFYCRPPHMFRFLRMMIFHTHTRTHPSHSLFLGLRSRCHFTGIESWAGILASFSLYCTYMRTVFFLLF